MKAVIVFFNEARTDFAIFGPFQEGEAKAEVARLRKTYVASAIREITVVKLIKKGAVK